MFPLKVLLILFLSPLLATGLCSCFSTERPPLPAAELQAVTAALDTLPLPSTPEEAIHQLMESNARLLHGERRWQPNGIHGNHFKPFGLVINATGKMIFREELFDLPPASLQLIHWEERPEVLPVFSLLPDNLRTVLILLPGDARDEQLEFGMEESPVVKHRERIKAVQEWLIKTGRGVRTAISTGRCGLAGATFDPQTKRLFCFAIDL